ncbi:MAG: ABC transporter substrate-binding protein, partial [Chloroflexi bacterium]|nr:ABC transporter substrate-binding protein [Chloroflexota bacterium]
MRARQVLFLTLLTISLLLVACGGTASPAATTAPVATTAATRAATSPAGGATTAATTVSGAATSAATTVSGAATTAATTVAGAATTAPTAAATRAGTPVPGSGKSITVAATWGGGEREAFLAVVDAFTKKTGIPVVYESMRNNMGAILRTRVAGGNPPDIALDPRPGEVAEFARAGNLTDLSKFVSANDLSAAFNQAYIDLGKVDGKQVGILWKANSKSTFWYKPASFQQLGVQTPKTLDDLFAIADKYVAGGKTPFAIGGKDGWVLTDYFENIMARVATPQQYNDLHMTHKLTWTDPTVKKALTQLARFFNTKYVPGGAQGVLGTQFVDSIGQVFGTNAKAEMFYEGGFVGVIATTDVNKSLKPEQDIDFFMFPQVDAQFGDPVIGGGDTAMMFKDTPEGRQ